MTSDGYEYVLHERRQCSVDSSTYSAWSEAVHLAAAHVEAELQTTREVSGKLESINSNRLQLKFARSIDVLSPALRPVVEMLEAQVVAAAGLQEELVLQDCYALFTPADEENEEARAPQRWHLDSVKKFPVAALCLKGGRWTEFADGPYSDFGDCSSLDLEQWSAPWRSLAVPTWESESVEEWEHWSRHLHAARLVTGDDECDWDRLPAAPRPPRSGTGDASIFWSNKLHRGPGTEVGEERLVLFCSWMPVGERRKPASGSSASRSAQSETDYSFYDGHLEPKLRLSERAGRNMKRAAEAALERPGRSRRARAPPGGCAACDGKHRPP